ncbi:MAG: AAA family ATPase [Gemmatimonadetes bacterium]|nr:AAA family ATPase [Gemmatimonadota bacterium]
MIKRDLEKRLIAYLSRRVEHPNVALLEGARQVGKTTLIESIRPKLDREILYLNLEEDNRAVHDLNSCRDFADFETYLATVYQFRGDGQRILCIDEAQESSVLGGFVRFMKEKWQHSPVILTGSSMSRIFGPETRFPVGRVTRFLLQPFSFREFLRCGKAEELLAFEDLFQIPLFLHERLLKYVQSYLDVGGLPAVASSFFDQMDWRQLRRDLYLDYRSDFARIFSATEASLFDQCLRGVASNLGSPSKYAQMVRTTSALYRRVPDFLALLESWKLIYKSNIQGTRPEQQGFSPKRYLYDPGLANDLRLTALPRIDILSSLDAAQRAPLGGIIENMLATELVALGQDLTGWKKGVNSSEVDFIFRTALGDTIPIECKASLVTRSRDTGGLSEYAARHGSNLGVLVNLDMPGKLTTSTGLKVIYIPVYLIDRLGDVVKQAE